MKTLRDFNPTDIVTIDGKIELGVFSVEQLLKIEKDASLSAYERGIRDAAEVAGRRFSYSTACLIKNEIESLLTKPKDKE